MVPGFNHNIKHNGQVYHVQTEDSGVKNPHMITHLFVGGNILASKKTSYAQLVGQDHLSETVKSMMEEQHKQMLRNLINGVYDKVDTGKSYELDGPAPLNTEGQPPSPAVPVVTSDVRPSPPRTEKPPVPTMPTGLMAPDSGPVPVAVMTTPPEPARDVPTEVRNAFESEATSEQSSASIFGEDLISEKSLDEVILNYLSDDMFED